jgi:hypothetical protein
MGDRIVQQVIDGVGHAAAVGAEDVDRLERVDHGLGGAGRKSRQRVGQAGEQDAYFRQRGRGGVHAGRRHSAGRLHDPPLAVHAVRARFVEGDRRRRVAGRSHRHGHVERDAAEFLVGNHAGRTQRIRAADEPAVQPAELRVHRECARRREMRAEAVERDVGQFDVRIAVNDRIARRRRTGGQRQTDREVQIRRLDVLDVRAGVRARDEPAEDDGGEGAADRVFVDDAEDRVQVEPRARRRRRGRRRLQFARRIVGGKQRRESGDEPAAESEIGIVGDVARQRRQQTRQQTQRVRRGILVEHREGHGAERRAEQNRVRHRRDSVRGAAYRVARLGVGDDNESACNAAEASEDPLQPRGLSGDAVGVSAREPAGGPAAERDEPVAGRRGRRREALWRDRARREIDQPIRGRVGPRERGAPRDGDVHDRVGHTADQILDVDRAR